MLITLSVSHFDILGNIDKDEQLANIQLIFSILFVFHLDISGR